MKYFWYGFLGLFSLGFLGAITSIGGFIYILHYYGKDLPNHEQLRNYEPPIVTRLYAGDGRLLAEFAQEKRVFVPIEFVPARLIQAFISAEDQNFYTHSGIDPKAVLRAIITNLKNAGTGRRPEGASTISQQVAKNFFLTNEVSYIRKIKEAILAYRMNSTLGKDHVLELYLNEIYLGGGAYGVAAAALYYFDKSLEELNIAEAAYLASLPKAPNNYHPEKHHDKALIRRDWVIDRMLAEEYITQSQADLAKFVPLKMTKKNSIEQVDAPYFAEEVRRELSNQYGVDSLYGGGLAVRTSVDPRLQHIAETVLRNGLLAYDMRHGWRGPLTTLEDMDDWRTKLTLIDKPEGMLREWSLATVLDVSKDTATLGFTELDQGIILLSDTKWARKYLNKGYARGPEVVSLNNVIKVGDIIIVQKKPAEIMQSEITQNEADNNTPYNNYILRQVPIIQGALMAMDPHTGRVLAMQGGWNYRYGGSEFNRATQAKRQPGSAFKPFVYLAALDKGFTPATLVLDAPFILEDAVSGTWKPTNYSNEFYGPTPIRVGIEKSRNLMTVRLADFLGMDLIAKYSDHFGITKNMRPLLANSLGSAETTLLDITTAYGMLVNGGKKITPTFIDRIQNRHGTTIFKHDKRECTHCGSMIKWEDQGVPYIPDIRAQIADPRTTYQMVSIMEGVVQRGTGIRLRSLNRPLAGKTGTTNESRDAWFIGFSPNLVVGVFAGFDNPRSLGRKETGSSVTVPIFKDFMEKALKDTPPVPFRRPTGIRNLQINADTGVRAKPGDKRIIWESFITGTEPTDEMYILDGDGISLMSRYALDDFSYAPTAQQYDPSTKSNDPNHPAGGQSAVTTGTGGLY